MWWCELEMVCSVWNWRVLYCVGIRRSSGGTLVVVQYLVLQLSDVSVDVLDLVIQHVSPVPAVIQAAVVVLYRPLEL